MRKFARIALVASLLIAPLMSFAAFQSDQFTEATLLDDGGCASTTFNRGIGAGFNSVAVALQGFSSTYVSSDHNMRRESARITGTSYNRITGNLAVSFEVCHHDQNSDDDFNWFVRYLVVKEV
jgi:ABC-type transport system substrate-binding protein